MSNAHLLQKNYRAWLLREYETRKFKNPSYSIRSFARSLGVSPATISLVLTGKGNLGVRAARKIADRCNLSDEEKNALMGTLYTDRERDTPKERKEKLLEVDCFRMISDWYHFAILGLAHIEGNSHSHSWIARKLGITKTQTAEAFGRLERMRIIEKRGSHFRQITEPLMTTQDIPDAAIKKFHKQMMEKTIESLDADSVEVRDMSSITLTIDRTQLPRAKNLIREFRTKMSDVLEVGERTEVYNLSVNLFPITK